ncbi:phage tail terminator family protein [Paenibacillus sp. FSL R5-0473]|uniref:phage tail terminator family protein n=1 Tax=Paenibacillus sp. FSL R5-0473 TaxID=2921642 RepID=UPI0030F71D56
MTTNQLTMAIANKLTHYFPNIPIHPATDSTISNPDTKGISYRLLSAQLTRERSDRFVQSHAFEIRWLDPNDIPATLPDELFEALETINVEGTPYRATELRWETENDTPRMLVYYTMRTTKVSESAATMQQLEQRSTALKAAKE